MTRYYYAEWQGCIDDILGIYRDAATPEFRRREMEDLLVSMGMVADGVRRDRRHRLESEVRDGITLLRDTWTTDYQRGRIEARLQEIAEIADDNDD